MGVLTAAITWLTRTPYRRVERSASIRQALSESEVDAKVLASWDDVVAIDVREARHTRTLAHEGAWTLIIAGLVIVVVGAGLYLQSPTRPDAVTNLGYATIVGSIFVLLGLVIALIVRVELWWRDRKRSPVSV